MSWLFARLNEPSTHAGIAAVLFAVGSFFPQYAVAINSFAGLFGFTAAVKAG